MRTSTALLLSLSAVVSLAAGCSDDNATDTAASSTTASTAVADGGTAPTEGLGCIGLASAAAPELAATTFPDNPTATWTVQAAEADGEDLALVEVVPDTDEVGYPAFTLAIACEGDEVTQLGTYALDGGAWVLQATTDAPGAADLPSTLP